MSVAALKEELRARGLLLGGLKRDLVERLKAAVGTEFSGDDDDDDGSDEAVEMEGSADDDDDCPDVGDGRIANELQPTPPTLPLI